MFLVLVPKSSDLVLGLHPDCFHVSLHQVSVIVRLTLHSLVELFAFLVLNIGLPVLSNLGGFQMFADALLQSLSVRAAGFGIVPVAAVAPSVL